MQAVVQCKPSCQSLEARRARQRLDPRAGAGTSLAAGGLQEAQRLVPQLALAERVQVVHDVPALGRLRSP